MAGKEAESGEKNRVKMAGITWIKWREKRQKMAGKNYLFGLMTNLSSTADFSSDVLVSMLKNFLSTTFEDIVGLWRVFAKNTY
jgi:hypothetical protein